jgi:hypothetical protein
MPDLEIFEYRIKIQDIDISIIRTKYNQDSWKITNNGGECLNKKGEWEWESIPSERSQNFLSRTRYTLENAKHTVDNLIAKWYQ